MTNLRRVAVMTAAGDPEFPGTLETLVPLGDGRRVVVRDDTGVVMLVDVEAGIVRSKTFHDPDEDDDGEFPPELDTLALVGHHAVTTRDQLLEIWDPMDFSKPVRAIAREPARTYDLVGHPDGRRVAILDEANVEIWDLDTGARLLRWDARADARRIATDAGGDELYVYSAESFAVHAWATGAVRRVDLDDAECLGVHPDGRVLVPDDWLIKIYARELDDGRDADDTFGCAPPTTGDCEGIAMLDADRAVSVHFGGTIVLFEVTAGRVLAMATDETRHPNRVAALSSTRFVVAPRSRDGLLELWEVDDSAAPGDDAGLGFSDLLVSGDDQVVARTPGGGSLVFDLMTGRALGPLPHAVRTIYADEHAVIGTNSSTILRFDRATGKTLASVHDHALDGAGGVHAFARNGSLLGCCVYDRDHFELVDLSVTDDELRWTRLAQPGGVTRVAFDGPDAAHVLVACADGAIAVWRVADRTLVRTLACRPCRFLTVGDTWLATFDAAGAVATFDLETGALLAELPATYRFAGGALVTADAAGEIVRWDPRTGARLAAHLAGSIRSIVTTRSGHVAWLDGRGELHRDELA